MKTSTRLMVFMAIFLAVGIVCLLARTDPAGPLAAGVACLAAAQVAALIEALPLRAPALPLATPCPHVDIDHGSRAITVRWKPIPGADTYTVKLYSEGREIHSAVVTESRWRVEDIPLGTYTFGVQAHVGEAS